jgi:DNA (cytosine-5)-methyltransferase 1
LPKLAAGEVEDKDGLHRAQKLAPINLRRIKQSKPNGTWRDWEPIVIWECEVADPSDLEGRLISLLNTEIPNSIST